MPSADALCARAGVKSPSGTIRAELGRLVAAARTARQHQALRPGLLRLYTVLYRTRESEGRGVAIAACAFYSVDVRNGPSAPRGTQLH